MSARHGKIARLPFEIREELNTRLLHGETAISLVPWLNAHPAVQAVLTDQFQEKPISEQNVPNWRQGGFCDWLGLRDWRAICAASAEGSAQIAATGFNAGNFLLLLTARLAANLDRWEATPDSGPLPQMTTLHRLIGTVLRIHQSELKDARLELDRKRVELQREKRSTTPTAAPAAGAASDPAPPVEAPSALKPEPVAEPVEQPKASKPLPTASPSQQPTAPSAPVSFQPLCSILSSPFHTPIPTPIHPGRRWQSTALAA